MSYSILFYYKAVIEMDMKRADFLVYHVSLFIFSETIQKFFCNLSTYFVFLRFSNISKYLGIGNSSKMSLSNLVFGLTDAPMHKFCGCFSDASPYLIGIRKKNSQELEDHFFPNNYFCYTFMQEHFVNFLCLPEV